MEVVLIVNPTLVVGGAERKIVDVAQYLSRQPACDGRAVYLLLEEDRPPEGSSSIFNDLVKESDVKIQRRPKSIWLGDRLTFFFYLLWKMLTLHPKVVLVFSRRLSTMALVIKTILWWRETKVVVSNDTIPSLDLHYYVHSPSARRMLAYSMRLFYPRAAVHIAPSDVAKRDLIENFLVSRQKIVVIKNWVRQNRRTPNSFRYDLIFVGRLERVKNLAFLLEIIDQVRKTVPTVSACIVGEGDDRDKLLNLTRRYRLESAMTFVGVQKDVDRYLSLSKIFCLTSQYEGMPIAALEAMAHGLPVITTLYPGADELVQPGITGFVCADQQEYAARITGLMLDEPYRSAMGKRAQEFVRKEHGEENLREFVRQFLE